MLLLAVIKFNFLIKLDHDAFRGLLIRGYKYSMLFNSRFTNFEVYQFDVFKFDVFKFDVYQIRGF